MTRVSIQFSTDQATKSRRISKTVSRLGENSSSRPGWSKRSHKLSYNAKSGVGIIVGLKTEKLLYIGVRNKYCTACRQGIPHEQHMCYKNWDASSSEMETDIILEGFKQAEQVHGVRYMHFVGDVYPTLIQNVPGWEHAIKKLECANHACKCYRGGLEKLVQENPSYKGKGGLTEKMRRRLTSEPVLPDVPSGCAARSTTPARHCNH